MSLTCRTILIDHASRRPLWDAYAAAAPPGALAPIDPRPFAPWDVSPLSAVYQAGDGPCPLADVLSALSRLQACKCHLCFARNQDHMLIILEKKERTPVDMPAMRRDIESLLQAGYPPKDEDTPWPIPVRDAANASTGTSGPHRRDCLPPGLRTLMLVDDEPMVRSLCQRVLTPHFLVCETADSFDALALADLAPFPMHLLITDVSLPRMDGIALGRRWLQRDPEARVLLLSGYAHTAAPAPEFSFLQKPFSADELLRLVTRLAEPAENAAAP